MIFLRWVVRSKTSKHQKTNMAINLAVSATMVVNDTIVKQGTQVKYEALKRLREQIVADNPQAAQTTQEGGSIAYGQLKTSTYRQDMLTGQE